MHEQVGGYSEVPRLTEGDLERIATDIVGGKSQLINLVGIDLVAVQQTVDIALRLEPNDLLVYNVDGLNFDGQITPLQLQAENELRKYRTVKALFTGYEFTTWYNWGLRQAARKIELEGIFRDGEAVVADALNRLDSQDTRQLLMWVSPAASFNTDLLESVAAEANFEPSDEFFGYEDVCWDLRDAGLARWGIPSSNYSIRPFLRPLLAEKFKQENPVLYDKVTELISSTVYAS